MSLAPQTTLDLQVILVERLEMKAEEFERLFDLEEQEDKLIIAKHRDSRGKAVWVNSDTWAAITKYVSSLGGAWDPNGQLWEIPKKETPQTKEAPSQPEAPKEPQEPLETEISTKVETQDEYDLKLSKQKLGALVPILTDAYGNIIDGFHRERIDPKWPRMKIGHITDPVQLSMARLAINVCRREVPAEEKTRLLKNIAELTGWDAKEIADALGMSYQWVMKYLPSEFKEKTWQRETSILQRRIKHESVKIEHSEEPERFESKSLTPTVPVKQIDTGFVFECPVCNGKFHIIHVDPSGKHKFEEDKML